MSAAMDDLPDELLVSIFSCLNAYELLPLRQVCSQWQCLIDESILAKKTAITDEDLGRDCHVFTRLQTLLFLLKKLPRIDELKWHQPTSRHEEVRLTLSKRDSSSKGALPQRPRELFDARIHIMFVREIVKTMTTLLQEDRVPLHCGMIDLIRSANSPLTGAWLDEYLHLDASAVAFPSAQFLVDRKPTPLLQQGSRQPDFWQQFRVALSALLDDSSEDLSGGWIPSSSGRFTPRLIESAVESGAEMLWKSLPKMNRLRQVTFGTISVNTRANDTITGNGGDVAGSLRTLKECLFSSKISFREIVLRDVSVEAHRRELRVNVILRKKDLFSLDAFLALMERLRSAENTHDTLSDIKDSVPGLTQMSIQPTFDVNVSLSGAISYDLFHGIAFMQDCSEGSPSKLASRCPLSMRHLLSSPEGLSPSKVSLNVTLNDVDMKSVTVLNESRVFQMTEHLSLSMSLIEESRNSGTTPASTPASIADRLWGMLAADGNLRNTKSLEVNLPGVVTDDCISTAPSIQTPLHNLESFRMLSTCLTSTLLHAISIIERATKLRSVKIHIENMGSPGTIHKHLPHIKTLLSTVGQKSALKSLEIRYLPYIPPSLSNQAKLKTRGNTLFVTSSTVVKLHPYVVDALRGLEELDSLSLELGPISGDKVSQVEVTLRDVFPRLRFVNICTQMDEWTALARFLGIRCPISTRVK